MLTIFPKLGIMVRFSKVFPIYFILFLTPLSSGEISSEVFFDLNTSSQAGINPAFHVRRTYMNYRKNISENISIRITTDAGSSTADERINVFVKMANLTWKTPFGDFIIGPQLTNYFGPEKKTWGYRFIEKFPGNLYGFDHTADLGISWKRSFRRLLIHLAAYNGTGFKKHENDPYKRISLLLSHGEQNLLNNPGMNIGSIFSMEPYATSLGELFVVYRLGGVVGYANSSLRLGGELHIEHDSGLEHRERVVAVYGSINKTKTVSLLARIDLFDISVNHPEMRKIMILTGLSYNPSSNFQVSPNIRYTFFGSKLLEPYWVSRLSFSYWF